MASMASAGTYYGELGLHSSATHRAVLLAYRQRALQTHPDKGGSHDAYVKVRQAFEVLSDPRSRAEYDAELRCRGLDADLTSASPRTSTSSTGPAAASRTSNEPLALTGDTPWQLAARTLVSMLDLPETTWASALEQHSMEVLECCKRQLQRSREAPNLRGQAAQESNTMSGEGPAIRGLYQTKRGTWEISLSIQRVQCAIFNVADIARAHDWHIALVELRQKVDEKMKRGKTDREAFRESIHEAYDADPELRLVLGFRVSIREARKVINGPFTYRLETALQLRNRVQQLRDMGGATYDIDKEIRDAKAYEKKQRDLQRARQAAMLQEVSTALEHLRREERKNRMVVPLALPAPEPEAVPVADAGSAAAAPSAPEPSGDVREVDMEYAVPMKGFLRFCRGMSLSKPQRNDLLKRVQDDIDVQRVIREAIVRHCGDLRGAPQLSIQDGKAPKSKRKSKGSNALVPVEPKKARQGRKDSGQSFELLNYRPPPGSRKKGLVELLLEKHEGKFYPGLLTLCELVRVTTTSRRIYSHSAVATKRQFTHFCLADFGRHTMRSKRGRALPNAGQQLRMLQECLRTRRFALHVKHLDLSSMEMAPISKEEFQYMLGCLPNLASVVLPSRGWAGTLQLRTFVNIAKQLKVSIGASANADIILRGAASRTPLPDEGHDQHPRPHTAPGRRSRTPDRGQKRRNEAPLALPAPPKTSRRSKEPRFTAAAVYQPPTFGRSPPDIPETPEAPPALQALQALRGGLRRPGPGPAAEPVPPAPMPRPAMPAMPAPAAAAGHRVLRLTSQRLERAPASPRSKPRSEEQHKFWWLDRM